MLTSRLEAPLTLTHSLSIVTRCGPLRTTTTTSHPACCLTLPSRCCELQLRNPSATIASLLWTAMSNWTVRSDWESPFLSPEFDRSLVVLKVLFCSKGRELRDLSAASCRLAGLEGIHDVLDCLPHAFETQLSLLRVPLRRGMRGEPPMAKNQTS